MHQTIIGTEKCANPPSRGLVLGIYADEHDSFDNGMLTPNAAKYNEVRGYTRKLYKPVKYLLILY